MKKILLLSTLIAILMSCNKDENTKIPTFDPHTQLVLNASKEVRNIPSAPYSIDTITRYAWNMGMKQTIGTEIVPVRQGIPTHDLENHKLRIGQMDDVVVIDRETGVPSLGNFTRDNVHDIILLAGYHADTTKGWIDAYLSRDMGHHDPFSSKYDTIGYVPNRELFIAQDSVRVAFAEEDWDKCMRLFEEAFTFIPITGAEYLKLEEQGLN